MSLRDEILGLDDRKVEEVVVPAWGGRKVRLKEMSAADRDDWELEIATQARAGGLPKNVRAKLVARCLVDEKGERAFSDEDIVALGKKSAAALDQLYDVCRRINGLTKKEAEDIAKN